MECRSFRHVNAGKQCGLLGAAGPGFARRHRSRACPTSARLMPKSATTADFGRAGASIRLRSRLSLAEPATGDAGAILSVDRAEMARGLVEEQRSLPVVATEAEIGGGRLFRG